MLIKGISFALLTLVNHAYGAAKTSDIFQVDFKADASGGCKTEGEATVDNYIEDCLTLAKAGVQLMNDYGPANLPAKRLVDALFKATDKDVVAADVVKYAKDNFQAVANFLDGTAKMNPKPYLFCQSTWLKRQTMNDDYLNKAGDKEYITLKSGKKSTKKNSKVGYLNDKKNDALRIGIQKPTPYWSQKHLSYLFDKGDYPDQSIGWCSGNGHLGVTQHDLQPATITICPLGWNSKKGLRQIPITTMTQAKLQDRASQSVTTTIEEISPTAATLFHELFHLVLGNYATTPPDNGQEVYDWATMMDLSPKDLRMNAETYTFAAIAYDITTNDTPVDGHRTEFYAYYATKGEK